MRRIIIDTDTASDDAAALILACKTEGVEILGVTVSGGNVSLEQAGRNALMTLEMAGSDAPVYLGASRPLFHTRKETISVHGKDGMGDKDIIHPTRTWEEKSAVDYILETLKANPAGEIEIVTLGPVTNIASAILIDRKTMERTKHIWSMGTPGFGPGNATPVSEFNVFIDAEAYALMLGLDVPVTMAGFDLCVGEIEIDKDEREFMKNASPLGAFLVDATSGLLEFNRKVRGEDLVDLPDAVAMAAALWPETVTSSCRVHSEVCLDAGPAYGQVIFYKEGSTYESMPDIPGYKDEVIVSVDEKKFTERFLGLFAI